MIKGTVLNWRADFGNSSSSNQASPVAWRNINLIGNVDFTTEHSPVNMEALAAFYQNKDFCLRSLQEADDDRPE